MALAILLILPLYLDQYQNDVLTLVGISVLLGLGLNIVVGYAGLLDLGYVAFFALGRTPTPFCPRTRCWWTAAATRSV